MNSHFHAVHWWITPFNAYTLAAKLLRRMTPHFNLTAGYMSASPPILIVDDDPALRKLYKRLLRDAGYVTLECGDGETALELCGTQPPALIVLDVRLPGLDGWEVLAALRSRGRSPLVLMLTDLNSVAERVRGLEGGADDYLGKPCDPSEFVARVRALLRRNPAQTTTENRRLRFGDLVVDLAHRQAAQRDRAVSLTATEFRLLDLLSAQPGKPVSREDILARIWEKRQGSSQALDTLVWRLRRKLGEPEVGPRWIQNLPGIGYLLPVSVVVTSAPQE